MGIKADASKLITVFHPGETLAEKLKEMEMSVKEFAVRVSKPEKTIFAVISGNSSITTDMAISFEMVTKIPASFWLRKQQMYDEYKVRKQREEEAKASIEWMKHFPYAEMVKRSWIESVKTPEERVRALFEFFGFSTEKAWSDYYLRQELPLAFRISLSSTKDPHAMSVWLRRGELQAKAEEQKTSFDEKKLKTMIPEMKQLMVDEPDDFFPRLQALCRECGMVLIVTPTLPKAPINGATRWIKDTPVIQLSGRYKGYDHLWFNFFHEVGHILLHGKKDIFLEKAGISGQDETKEKEADNYASDVLLAKSDELEFLRNASFSRAGILDAAKKYNTHPSILVGRLKHLGVMEYWQGQDFNKHVDIS
ncbi:MAG: HigA family addiction module antidote protein [Bacteroidales bacterium]|nr:HigA family addiction module antidote protein [Bacteroidales bacterium]